ncbi:BMC domain-containing protein [Desulfovibrio gilichinskyi]|uniref:Carboxysome shell and ethanolamine utilization microcompartment protein CcmL/EutN n=1 Tax=Desulfovibrio gilichinskyi TaxID=1519643 RepID=A0A1X7E8H8_9BACT|nr:Carboxysome shell and ethanolamine utilization microcompartment protein CcmL/EutN [Desulfovibrio gilichinskyi]
MAALGFIETKGLLAAVEGADAMLKAADVHLLEKNLVGGGLVSITIEGEVSAVKASVDAAVSAIGRICGSTLVSQHVIARPDEELKRIIATKPVQVNAPEFKEEAKVEHEEAPVEVSEPAVEIKKDLDKVENLSSNILDKISEPSVKAEPVRYQISDLEKMKIGKLRQIARTMSDLSLTREEIKSSAKKALIEAIIKVTGR